MMPAATGAEACLTAPSRIVLIGFMGAGKSTIGRLLAAYLGYQFVDTDQRLIHQFKLPIYKIFQQFGETAFRQAESALMHQLLDVDKVVVATGGGTVSREDVFSFVTNSRSSILVYLKADVDVLYERVIFSPKDRPLIDVPNAEIAFRQRFAERERFYNKAPIHIETTNQPPNDIVMRIVEALKAQEDQDKQHCDKQEETQPEPHSPQLNAPDSTN
jgi:shikimate kinase